MEKNKMGQPFQSVYNFPIYVQSKNKLHVRNGNKVDLRENIINMYTWGIKANLDYDFYLGQKGALICLLSKEYDSVDNLIEQNPTIKELANSGYELAIGDGYSIYSTGKVKPKISQNEKPTNMALYCTNYKIFLQKKEQSENVNILENMVKDVDGLSPLPDDIKIADFNKYEDIDGISEKITKRI